MKRSNKTRSTLVALAFSLAIASFAFSEPALAAGSQNSVVMHESIVLTSTSGVYINMTDGSPSVVGPASGTMTLEVVNGVTYGYLLTMKSGSVDLGSEHVTFLKGTAFMNNLETYIRGSGIAGGPTATDPRGTFTFSAFSLSPTVRGSPLDFNVLVVHLHIGAAQYEVLLHVTTSIIVGS
ncbi:MAG TPA: hypothetical protein VKF39_01555 [Nitrososphaerales archaeon]|nr:hypothetical protein [Nitrososphaerales archaeon]